EERAKVPKLMKINRMMLQGRHDPVVFRRFDYGGASYFVMEGGQTVPFSAIIVRQGEGRWDWSPKAMEDPMGQVLSDLVVAFMQDPVAFAPVRGPFQASLSLMPLYGEERANPVSLSFRRACRANFVAYDATEHVSKSAAGCPEDVN